MILFKGGDITLDDLSEICNNVISGLPLTNAAGEAGALCHPVSIFTRIDDNLSHLTPSFPDLSVQPLHTGHFRKSVIISVRYALMACAAEYCGTAK